MTLAADRPAVDQRFRIEDISTGPFASGFGVVGDGDQIEVISEGAWRRFPPGENG